MNEKLILTARQKVGEYLKSIREEKGFTLYKVAKDAGVSIHSLESVEAGNASYTFDTFLSVTHAMDCYFFLEDKDGKHLDFVDMAKKAIDKKRVQKQ